MRALVWWLLRMTGLGCAVLLCNGRPQLQQPQLVLDATSAAMLDSVLARFEFSAVLYFAEWCPHSQALAAALHCAATAFAADRGVAFVQLRERGNREAFAEAGVTDVPVLQWVQQRPRERGGGGRDDDSAALPERVTFDGARTAASVVKWMHHLRYGTSLLTLRNLGQARAFARLPMPTAVSWFHNESRGAADEFVAADGRTHSSSPPPSSYSAAAAAVLPKLFADACEASDDVLCGVFEPDADSTHSEVARVVVLVVAPAAAAAVAAEEEVMLEVGAGGTAIAGAVRNSRGGGGGGGGGGSGGGGGGSGGGGGGSGGGGGGSGGSNFTFVFAADGEEFALLRSTVSVFPSAILDEQARACCVILSAAAAATTTHALRSIRSRRGRAPNWLHTCAPVRSQYVVPLACFVGVIAGDCRCLRLPWLC
jgi:hypothetical protein